MYQFLYGVNCALEDVAPNAPVILRGSIEDVARQASEIGYEALELFIRNPKQYKATALKRAADDNGIGFCGIATGMEYTKNKLSLIDDDANVRQSAIERLKEHIDLAHVLGCPVIVGIMRANIPDFSQYALYEGRFSDALRSLSAHAAAAGVPLVVEAILRYINNYLCSVPETMDYLEKLALPNVKLHIDSHLMNVEDKDIAASIRYGSGRLAYVHMSDSNRAYPGGGGFDFKTMMAALMDVEYQGYLTTECQPYPDPYTCAKRGLDYCRHLEALLAIERLPLHEKLA